MSLSLLSHSHTLVNLWAIHFAFCELLFFSLLLILSASIYCWTALRSTPFFNPRRWFLRWRRSSSERHEDEDEDDDERLWSSSISGKTINHHHRRFCFLWLRDMVDPFMVIHVRSLIWLRKKKRKKRKKTQNKQTPHLSNTVTEILALGNTPTFDFTIFDQIFTLSLTLAFELF